jgi:putative FmdB family regulatory protein
MPIYEYACKACGHTFDTIQSFKDEPLTDCPVCKEPALKKLISATDFHLKGSGWYVTDFKNPPVKKDSHEKAKTDIRQSEESNKTQKSEIQTRETVPTKPTDKPSKTDKSDTKSS